MAAVGNPGCRWLEAVDAAAKRRDADRACDVGADADEGAPEGQKSTFAAGGTTSREVCVVRVEGTSVDVVV